MAAQILYATVSSMIVPLGFTKKLGGRLADTIQETLNDITHRASICGCKSINEKQFVVYFRDKSIEPIKVTLEV